MTKKQRGSLTERLEAQVSDKTLSYARQRIARRRGESQLGFEVGTGTNDKETPAELVGQLALVAIDGRSKEERREALALLRSLAPEAERTVSDEVRLVLWEMARRLMRSDDLDALEQSIHVAMAYDRGFDRQEYGGGSILDEVLSSSRSVGIRRHVMRAMVEKGGWGAIERVGMFFREEDADALALELAQLVRRQKKLEDLTPGGFEYLVGHALRKDYADLHTSVVGGAFDRGVDLVVYDGDAVRPGTWPAEVRHVVQCKRWKNKVRFEQVKPVVSIALGREADAIFVTSSSYVEQHLDPALLELKGYTRRVETPGRSGITIRIDADCIRGWFPEEGTRPLTGRDLGKRPHVDVRLIDRSALKEMMGEMAAGYDFSV